MSSGIGGGVWGRLLFFIVCACDGYRLWVYWNVSEHLSLMIGRSLPSYFNYDLAGKSILLHAIAGRVTESQKLDLEGRRYLNGQKVDGDALLPAAMVEQEVNFFPHMTVRETLDFRVELEMGRALTADQRDALVRDLMEQMGLTDAADTVVGDSKVRGVSGGERKRLSVAVELIQSPSIIFLDEPTSGLDSTAATTLIQNLRALADQGKTVVAVIHQPSQHVFSKFDDLMLVSDGRLMYFGDLRDVRSHMEHMGYRAPSDMGTAEHVLDCISRQPLEDETEDEAEERVERIAEAAQKMNLKLPKDKSGEQFQQVRPGRRGPKAGILRQFAMLLKRSFREVTRGKTAILVKTVQQISLGLIYGGIYKLGKDQASIQDRFGLLSLVAIGSSNMVGLFYLDIQIFPCLGFSLFSRCRRCCEFLTQGCRRHYSGLPKRKSHRLQRNRFQNVPHPAVLYWKGPVGSTAYISLQWCLWCRPL